MAIAELHTGSATIGVAEWSLVTNSATPQASVVDGVYQVFIDFSNLTITETYTIRIDEKVTSGGTQKIIYEATVVGAQSEHWVSPSLILLHGWDVSLQRVGAGTDRSISWSIRQVA